MSEQPIVSVVMPVYNAEKYLRECLDSVVGQTLREIEIICVDDGSKDNSLTILNEYAERDGRVHILTQKNQYAGVARNNGLAAAQGKYVIFLDSDDFFEPEMLEIAVKRAEECRAQITLFGGWRYHLENGQDEPMSWVVKEELMPLVQPFSAKDTAQHVFQLTSPAPWNKLYLRSFVQSLDLQYQAISNSNDLFFTLSALAEAERIAYSTVKLIHYRVGQSTNLQSTRNKNPTNFYQALLGLKNRLIERGLMDTFRASYLVAAQENCDYNLRSISEEALSREQREEIRRSLFEELPAEPERPEITVIVPVYNVEKYLRTCLDSLSAQSLRNIEILCVNDGSTDGSLAILEEYAGRDERIRVIDKKQNEGLLLARKSGVMEASGRYITFVDSDDELASDACEVMCREMEKNPTDIIQFNVELDDKTSQIGATDWHERAFRPTRDLLKRRALMKTFFLERSNVTTMYAKVFTRELCVTAYSHIPDYYCYVGEDIVSMFYLSLYALTWRGVPNYKAYTYRYGSGVSNADAVALSKFNQYSGMSTSVNHLRRFLQEHLCDDAALSALDAMSLRMLVDCFRMFRGRIAEENLPEAAKRLKNDWKDCPVYAEAMAQVLNLTPEEFDGRYLQVPVFEQLGAAYADGSTPKISVILPVCNGGAALEEGLNGLRAQTLRDVEFICINDGSTDDSLSALLRFAEEDERVSVVSQLCGGLSAARNRGLGMARGEYVYFADAYHSLIPEALERLCRLCGSDGPDVLTFGTNGEASDEALTASAPEDVFAAFLSGTDYCPEASAQLYRHAFLQSCGLRFPEGEVRDEEVFVPTALGRASTAVLTGSVLARRTGEEGRSSSIGEYNRLFSAAMMLLSGALEEKEGSSVRQFLFERAKKLYYRAKEAYGLLTENEQLAVLRDSPEEICFLHSCQGYSTDASDARNAALIRSSASYRIGEKLMWLPNKIRSGIYCLKDNGLAFTIRRLFFHLGIRL